MMALPQKDFFKISEICQLWNCTEDDIIQFSASQNLLIHADFNGYVIVDGKYNSLLLPEKIKFGQTIGRLFTFDINFNNPTAIHEPNLQNIYPFQFKVPLKDQIKVYFYNAFSNKEEPILLELGKHYDVNTINSYIQMLIPLQDFDKIAIIPSLQKWLEDIAVQRSNGFEQLRNDDLKKFITKEKVQIEYLQPQKQGYFRCIAEGKNQELPWIDRSNLYISLASKMQFEQKFLTAENNKETPQIKSKKTKRASKKITELLNLAQYEINNNRQFTAFCKLIKEYQFPIKQNDTCKINNKKYYNIFDEAEENYPYNIYVTPSEKGSILHFTFKRGQEIEINNIALSTFQKYFTFIKENSTETA